MSDKMGGSSTERVPAWKLRQQQRQNRKPPSGLDVNDELSSTRSSYSSQRRAKNDLDVSNSSRRRAKNDLDISNSSQRRAKNDLDVSNSSQRRAKNDLDTSNSSRRRANDELNRTNSSSGSVPAWKLREKEKARRMGGHNFDDNTSVLSMNSIKSNNSYTSFYSRGSVSSRQSRSVRAVSRVPGAPDPSLPPAFRSAFDKQQQRKKNSDDFLSLSSIHSRSRTDACSTLANTIGSDSSLSDDDSDEDSFASVDSDADEDDEAYRESRNQLARLNIEKQDMKRVGKPSRFKKKTKDVHGNTLGLIAE